MSHGCAFAPAREAWALTSPIGRETVVQAVRMSLMLLGVAMLPFGVAACGGDDTKTVTVTTPAAGATSTSDDEGTVVKVELGESGSTYFVRPDRATVDAGKVTFAVTNVGKLYHEFIVYTNADDI